MGANSDVELPDQGDNIIRTKDVEVSLNPAGFGYELFTHLKKHGDKLAQIDAETGVTENFSDLYIRILRVALHLKERGVKPGDIVVPCTTNHLNTAVVFVAPILIGAQVSCFDPNALYADTKFLLELMKPKVVFASQVAVMNLEKIKEDSNMDMEIVVFGTSSKHTPFDEYLKPFPKEQEDNFEPYRVKSLLETATITLSSGSTGTPKGLCANHFVILSQFRKMKFSGLATGVVYSPIAWLSGQFSIAIQIMAGAPKLICEKFTPEKTWRYLAKYKANTLTLPPQDAMLLLRYGNPQKVETPYLRVVIVAGGKASVENMTALSKIFLNHVQVICPYGQSEFFGGLLSFDLELFAKNPATAGKPIEGFWYKVVDPDTNRICGPNEQGELLIKSKFCMSGYYKQDSSHRFDSDGFLKTGDVVYYDEEHCFYIVERLGERLKYKSQWISPAYLESILYEHPAVKVACVIGVVSDDGDVATGIVVKETDVTEEELVKHVNDRVDDIKKLRGGIIFVDESLVAYTASGKIRRFLLRKRVLEEYRALIKSKIPTYIETVNFVH